MVDVPNERPARPEHPSNVLLFPVGRSGTRARRRPDSPATQPVRAGAGPELRITVVQAAFGRPGRDVGDRRDSLERAVDAAVAGLVSTEPSDVALDGSTQRPVLTASFDGTEHAHRALAASLAIRDAVDEAARADRTRITVSIGVHTGGVVDLAVGGTDTVPFRATGMLFSLTARLQDEADIGQILLSADTLGHVTSVASVHPEDDVEINRHGEQREVFCLLGLRTLADA